MFPSPAEARQNYPRLAYLPSWRTAMADALILREAGIAAPTDIHRPAVLSDPRGRGVKILRVFDRELTPFDQVCYD
jgi:hypothetical protein